MASGLKAVLFDLDGTLVDSAPMWFDVEDDFVTDNGGRWTPKLAAKLHGRPFDWCVEVMMKEAGVKGPIEPVADALTAQMAERIKADGAPWLPGVKKLVKELRDSELKTAIVSNSYQAYVQAVADAAPTGAFDIIVSGDEVKKGKPSPKAYKRAAKMLNVDPRECLVIEDSESGVIAGRAAGMAVLAVPFGVPLDPSLYDDMRESLKDVTLKDLKKIVKKAQ